MNVAPVETFSISGCTAHTNTAPFPWFIDCNEYAWNSSGVQTFLCLFSVSVTGRRFYTSTPTLLTVPMRQLQASGRHSYCSENWQEGFSSLQQWSRDSTLHCKGADCGTAVLKSPCGNVFLLFGVGLTLTTAQTVVLWHILIPTIIMDHRRQEQICRLLKENLQTEWAFTVADLNKQVNEQKT